MVALDEERLRAKGAAIAALDERTKQKEDELSEIHGRAHGTLGKPKPVAVCACGAEIYDGAKFCGRRGKKLDHI